MEKDGNITKAHRRFRSMGLTLSTMKRIVNMLPALPPGTSIDVVVGANIGSSLKGVGKAVFWVGMGSDRLGSSLL